jgi:hypothetical protein
MLASFQAGSSNAVAILGTCHCFPGDYASYYVELFFLHSFVHASGSVGGCRAARCSSYIRRLEMSPKHAGRRAEGDT